MWDSLFCKTKAPAFSEPVALLDLENKAPKWLSYMQRLRAHPKIASTCMKQEAMDRYAEICLGWPKDQKCQLSLVMLKGLFPDCP